MILTSCLFDGKNYTTWARAIKNALKSKNKLGFVNGLIKKPQANFRSQLLGDMQLRDHIMDF